MKQLASNAKAAMILTPAIFLMAFWILALSDAGIISSAGASEMIGWALLLSFGIAFSVTIYVNELLKRPEEK